MLGYHSCRIGAAIAALLCSVPALARTVHAERHAGSTEAHRSLGSMPAPTTSWLERGVTWAAAGRLEFDHFVDGEPSGDRLVLLLGTQSSDCDEPRSPTPSCEAADDEAALPRPAAPFRCDRM